MKRGSVLIAYADGGEWSGYFGHSLAMAERQIAGNVIGRYREVGGPAIADHRNQITEVFKGTNAEWLAMLDTDMDWPADGLKRLLASAHYRDRPVVGALTFGANRSGTVIYPTLYWWTDKGVERGDDKDLRSGGMLEVDGTGAACLLIHRDVIDKVTAEHPYPKGPWEFTWYNDPVTGGLRRMGEDMTFCLRVRNAGFPIHINMDVVVGHVKPVIIDLDYYERFREWNPPPANPK